MYDRTSTIEHFLTAAAAKQPAPGGGSVTALVGALASSMGEMALNYTLGKKSLEAYEAQNRVALQEFHRARHLMLELMAEDQAAYQSLTAARKLPENTPDREAQINISLLASIRTPQAIAAAAVAVLGVCNQVVDTINHHLLSDLAVCADLAMATVRCAGSNVRVNVADLPDPNDKASIEATTAATLAHGLALIQRVIPRIWVRHSRGA